MVVRLENGELRGTILGPDPTLDSPTMYLQTTRRHYVVLRMMYYGDATEGLLLYKSGPKPTSSDNLDYKGAYWTNRRPVTIIDTSSVGLSANTSVNNLLDGNIYTVWETAKSFSEYVVFDLGDVRWITSILITSQGDNTSPKNCLLQVSRSSGVGPFTNIATFQLEKGYDRQAVNGFSGHARYFRLLLLDNYNATTIKIRQVELQGYDDQISMASFPIENTGKYRSYYVPIHQSLDGTLLRMRLQLTSRVTRITTPGLAAPPMYREGFALDYVRVARSPEVWRVRGCLDKYYDNVNRENPHYNVDTKVSFKKKIF